MSEERKATVLKETLFKEKEKKRLSLGVAGSGGSPMGSPCGKAVRMTSSHVGGLRSISLFPSWSLETVTQIRFSLHGRGII